MLSESIRVKLSPNIDKFKLNRDFIRPKSLQGIEDNNGWIKIESEADLPKSNIECWFMLKDNDIQIGMFAPHKLAFGGVDEDYYFRQITHYQPIEKPQPPIY